MRTLKWKLNRRILWHIQNYSTIKLAEFILEDEKLVTDGIPTEKIPTDMNLRTINHLKVTTDPRPFSTRDSPADTANTSVKLQLRVDRENWERSGRDTCKQNKYYLFY